MDTNTLARHQIFMPGCGHASVWPSCPLAYMCDVTFLAPVAFSRSAGPGGWSSERVLTCLLSQFIHTVPFCQGRVSTFTAFSFIPPTPLLHRSAPFCSWWAWLVSFTRDVICFVGWCRHSVPHFTFLYEFLWITARLHVLLGLDFYGTWHRWNTPAS